MKKISINASILALIVIWVAASCVLAQTTKEVIVKASPSPDLVKGKQLFETNCASCHGKDGRGNGPVAPALKVKPTDLTLIAKANRGKFDEVHVMAFVDGEKAVSAHGTREMPVWGTRFRHVEGQMESSLNIYSLMKYIESIQAK